MEETKYFTPDIEDLHFGYEAVFRNDLTGEYEPWTIRHVSPDFIYKLEDKRIQAPYLTKEQIEGEGWTFGGVTVGEYATDLDDGHFMFIKGDRCFSLHRNNNFDIYGKNDSHYVGPIKSINEFRQVLKLLNIK